MLLYSHAHRGFVPLHRALSVHLLLDDPPTNRYPLWQVYLTILPYVKVPPFNLPYDIDPGFPQFTSAIFIKLYYLWFIFSFNYCNEYKTLHKEEVKYTRGLFKRIWRKKLTKTNSQTVYWSQLKTYQHEAKESLAMISDAPKGKIYPAPYATQVALTRVIRFVIFENKKMSYNTFNITRSVVFYLSDNPLKKSW